MAGDIEPVRQQLVTHVEGYTQGLTAYLDALGLPATDIVVINKERAQVINLVPAVIENLTPDRLASAQYLSKFVAACVAGLFDAALNYLWDETVRSLRSKVVQFDLGYFFDTAVKDPTERQKYNGESDLEKLPDWQLIEGCRDTGIISDNAKRHMDYIRDQRNHASAAHPNQNEIHGIQLSGWLQTCLEEVIAREPEAPAIEAKRLLYNIRESALDQGSAGPVCAAITGLPPLLASTLLRSVFGMYTDVRLPIPVKTNIRFIARHLWVTAPEDIRKEVGLKHASLAANAEVERTKLAREFIDLVDGAEYLSTDTRALELTSAIEGLLNAHNGWNNFYNEAAPARALASLVPDTGVIPPAVLDPYVRALTLVHIGNGHGVALAAESTYQQLIDRWREEQIAAFLIVVARDPDISSRLQFRSCRERLISMAKKLVAQTGNTVIQRVISALVTFPVDSLSNFGRETRIKDMIALLVPLAQAK